MTTTDKAKQLIELARKSNWLEFRRINGCYSTLVAKSDPTTVTEICEAYLGIVSQFDWAIEDAVTSKERIQELEAELKTLKDPSDGRCMEIGALRERNKELESKFAKEIDGFDIFQHHQKRIQELGAALKEECWCADMCPGVAVCDPCKALAKAGAK